MPAVEFSVTSSEPGLVKMEDRKRPAADNDSAPPLKKQATTANGGNKPHPDADMPWKDDLEVRTVPGGVPIMQVGLQSLDMMLTRILR
jgi:hypothetical protein